MANYDGNQSVKIPGGSGPKGVTGEQYTDGSDTRVGMNVAGAGADFTNMADSVQTINGPETQNNPQPIAEVTNGTDGTYTYYIPGTLLNRSIGNIQAIISGGSGTCTLTIEATWENNGTAAASCDYTDITQYGMTNLTGADAASYTASTALASKENVIPTYYKIKVVAATSGSNDADWTVHGEQYYK